MNLHTQTRHLGGHKHLTTGFTDIISLLRSVFATLHIESTPDEHNKLLFELSIS